MESVQGERPCGVGLKIILSRKGFDASAGGIASPILPDGTLFSLPIPFPGEPITYAHIQFQFQDHSAVQMLSDVRPGGYRFNKGEPKVEWADVPAHLDPDLRAGDLHRAVGWKPLFGQADASQTHLRENRVGSGDIFLFFGWFRKTKWDDDKLIYDPGAPNLHVVFGWLKVDCVWAVPQCPPTHLPQWALYHPHALRNYARANNTIYCAAQGGAFRRFDPILQLTARGIRQRSQWHLPAWFYPFHSGSLRPPLTQRADPSRWALRDGHVTFDSGGRGQEFVLDVDRYPEAAAWVEEILARPTH